MTLTADVLGQPIEQSFRFNFPSVEESNPEIDRLWASTRVNALMDTLRRSGPNDSTIGEIVRLCEGYSIVSEYASFIVLENDAEYQRWSIERRNATRIQRDRQAQAAVQQQLAELREQALSRLGPTAEKLVSAERDPAVSEPTSKNVDAQNTSPQTMNEPSNRPGDLNFTVPANPSRNEVGGGDSGGGGAIDPITGLVAAGAAAASAFAARRKRKS